MTRAQRAWRHLDFFEYQTVLTAEVSRVKCPGHGCHQGRVPWSEERSRYTHLFEQLRAVAERAGQAWKLKELARSLWQGMSREQTEADWDRWIRLAQHSGLPAMARAAETIR